MKAILSITILSLLIASPLFAIPISVDAGTDGFAGWTLDPASNTGTRGLFLGTSGTSIDTGAGNEAWGLYANTGDTSSATYMFGRSLLVGETVKIDVTIGFINNGGTIGFGLQNSANDNRFETYYRGGDATDAWKINDAGGEENIAGPFTSFFLSTWQIGNLNSLQFEYTQLAGNQYDLSVNGTPITNSGKNLVVSDISQIRIYNFDAGSGGTNNQYFNNLEVIPEPRMALLFLCGFGLIAFLRRRK